MFGFVNNTGLTILNDVQAGRMWICTADRQNGTQPASPAVRYTKTDAVLARDMQPTVQPLSDEEEHRVSVGNVFAKLFRTIPNQNLVCDTLKES